MLGFKGYTNYLNEAAKRAESTLSNDDRGKMYELSLAREINNHEEVGRGNRLPRHWRSRSENKEHAGTPGEVFNRLKKKAGAGSPEVTKIKTQAKQTASHIVDSLKDSGHLGKTSTNGVKHPPTKVTNVFWTSNRDTEKKAGDHELTSGIRDTNSRGDLMLTISPKHEKGHFGEHHDHYEAGHAAGVTALVNKRRADSAGETYTPPKNPHPKGSPEHKAWSSGFGHGQLATHVNISAKYAANPINYENAGHTSMERKTGSAGLAKKLSDEQKSSDENIAEKFGYTGESHKESHEKFKADRDVLDAEKKAHKKKNGDLTTFAPKSEAAKRAHGAYAESNASLRRGIKHVANAISKMSEEGKKKFISSAVVPDTVHTSLVAHSNPDSGKNTVHSPGAYQEHLDQYKDLEVRHGSEGEEGGTSLHIYGTHKKTGERKPIFSLGYKTNSGAMGPRQFNVRLPQFK